MRATRRISIHATPGEVHAPTRPPVRRRRPHLPHRHRRPGARGHHRADTTRVTQLPELNVTVTRTTEPLERVPFAVGVLDREDLVRGQQTVGIDEALNNLPGVVVANRYNFSLDQRISIRGFGSRSNFGVRGLKILVDGIPRPCRTDRASSPTWTSPTWSAPRCCGSSSSLYGNASGGVISFQTERAAPARSPSGCGCRAATASGPATASTSGRAGPRAAPVT